MSHFTFHTSGGDRHELERQLARHEILRPRREFIVDRIRDWASSSPLKTIACGLLVLAVVSSIAPPPPPQPGERVITRHLLIFRDTSGSMANTAPRMAVELEPLNAYGVDLSNVIEVGGFGVRHDAEENFLYPLRLAVNDSKADAVYLFSDFQFVDLGLDDDDAEGFAELRQILREHHMRLYLRSVRYRPAEELIAIARESGGDYIEP